MRLLTFPNNVSENPARSSRLEEWPTLIEKALSENLDAVFGSRTLGGRAIYVYAQNYVGVLALNVIINLLYGSRYTDTGTEVKIDGDEYLILREDDVLGIVEE